MPLAAGPAEIRMMSQTSRKTTRRLKPVVAGLMAAIVVLLTILATSENLHRKLHAPSGDYHNGCCALCRIAEGQVDVPVTAVLKIFAPASLSWAVPPPENGAPQTADFSVASNRGPPAFVFSV